MNRLLLIDDDVRLTDMVGDYLRHNGFEVDTAGSLAAGRERLSQGSYDALVLDLMLPDGDGLDLTRELRAQAAHAPAAAADAHGARRAHRPHRGPGTRCRRLPGQALRAARVAGAREGAAAPRRARRRATTTVLRFGRLEVDLGARQARLDGQPCDLTSHQFELLMVLARSPGRVLSRDQIMDALKGHPLEAFDRSIDVHISRIRAVIEDDPKIAAARADGARHRLRIRQEAGHRVVHAQPLATLPTRPRRCATSSKTSIER